MNFAIYFDKSKRKEAIQVSLSLLDELQFETMEIYCTGYYETNRASYDIQSIRKILQSAEQSIDLLLRKDNGNTLNVAIKSNRNSIIGCNEERGSHEIYHLLFFNLVQMPLKYASMDLSKFVFASSVNAVDIDYWKMENVLIPEPMIFIDDNLRGKKILSYEHIPSHGHYMSSGDELIFEACWQMYFGEIYYKYIPKPLFDDFTDCEENVLMDNGSRKIKLYKKPEDFGKPYAVARQWSFRRRLGIDSIAHEFTKDNNRIEPENLPVIITKNNCSWGTTKVTRFLDTNNQLVERASLAIKKEIKEYLDDGVTVVDEIIEIL